MAAIKRTLPSIWVCLLEQNSGSASVQIDRQNGIIRNVRVLGVKSPNTPMQNGAPMPGVTNGTRYTPSAFQTAVRIFEGAKVRLNHPSRKNPNEERQVEDSFGVLRNVRAFPDGVRADLHYLTSHEFAPRVLEDVERRLGVWGFSPNAVGLGQVRDGVYIVEEIAHVRSVDLVSDPATTVNLWESRGEQPMTVTFRNLLESALPVLKGKQRIALVDVLEMDYMKEPVKQADSLEEDPMPPNVGDTQVEPMADGGDPMEAISAGFTTALKSLVDAAMSGSMSEDEACSKFKELMKTHSKLKGNESSVEKPAETSADDEGDEEEVETEESKKMSDAELAELQRLRADKAVSQLCESLNFKPTQTQREALVALSESSRPQFVKELIAMERKPVSKTLHNVTQPEKKTESKTMTVEQFVAQLRR